MQTRIEQANNFVLHKLPVFFVLLLSVLLTLGIGCGDDSSPLADGAAPSMVDAADAGMVDAEAESLNEDAAMPNLDGGSISAVADDLAVTARQVPVAINVLSNDSLVGEWDIVGVTEPSLGRVEITPTRELRYTPDASQPGGSTEVQYTVARRGWSETLSAKVAITILPDLGTVSGGQLYTAVDDSLEEKPQGFLWTAIRNDGSRIGGNWDSSWFLQKPNGTRVNAPFPAIDPVTGVVESWLGDFGPGNSMVGYYTILGADQKYYSVSVSWDGGDTLKELSSGVYQVYGSNASGTSVGSNIHVSPNPYSGVWLKEGGSATLVTHPNPSVISTVLYDANDEGAALGYVEKPGSRCFLVAPGGTVKELAAPSSFPTWERQRCFGLNNRGEIVGTGSRMNYGHAQAFRITADGTWHRVVFPFPRVDGDEGRGEEARSINDSGVIVGVYSAKVNVKTGETTERKTVKHPVTITPVKASPGTRFEDTLPLN